MTGQNRPVFVGTCPTCGKRSFRSRKDARRAGRAAHPGAHLSEYRCGDDWHYGNLPDAIRQGNRDRSWLEGGND